MKPAFRDSLALFIAALGPLVMAYLGFVALSNDVDHGQSMLAVVYSVGKVLQFGFPLLYVAILERGQLRTISLASRGLLLGVTFALVVDASIFALYFAVLRDSELLADTPAKIWGKLQEFHLATPIGYLAIGFFICVLHSLLEEYYWRWFVFGWLRKYVPLGWAIVFSSVGFMAHHVVILYVYFPGRFWMLAAPLSLGVAVGGAVWSWMYQRTGSLLTPWVSHVLVDAAILLVGYDMLRAMWP